MRKWHMSFIKLTIFSIVFLSSNLVHARIYQSVIWKGYRFSLKSSYKLQFNVTPQTLTVKGLPVRLLFKVAAVSGLNQKSIDYFAKARRVELKKEQLYLFRMGPVRQYIGYPRMKSWEVQFFKKGKDGRIIEHHHFFRCPHDTTIFELTYEYDHKMRFNRTVTREMLWIVDRLKCQKQKNGTN